jgi:hypothetical protein
MRYLAFLSLTIVASSLGCKDDDKGSDGAAGKSSTSGGAPSTSSGGSSSVAGSPGSGGAAAGSAGTSGDAGSAGAVSVSSKMTFFVSSTGSQTGNLGGLAAADEKCKTLAAAAGAEATTWRAYLSVDKGPDNKPVNAKDRIGKGPWHNAAGVLLAENVAELHTKLGDYKLFLDDKGLPVPGQWTGSPKPNVHDILTGTNVDGTLKSGNTCADWTSAESTLTAWVGHSDGLGPGGSMDDMYRPWNSVHENGGCNDTAPRGGGGRIYCFAVSE